MVTAATTQRAGSGSVLSEAAWQSRVVDYAALRGWLTYHTKDSRRSAPGFPDLVMVRAGVLLLAELKTETGRPTADQRRWLAALSAVPGVTVRLWRPSHWPDVEAVLR